jgi:uncharacterized protein (DUF362 family)
LVDGIVGGEGQGPLEPKPVRSGVLLFSDNLLAADLACASMMGFNPERIPMSREALRLSRYSLLGHKLDGEVIIYNGRASIISELLSLASHQYETPLG